MIHEHVSTFAGKKVEDWDPKRGIAKPDTTLYRLATVYDSDESWTDLFADFSHDPAIEQVTGIIVGRWGTDSDDPSTEIVEAIVSARDKLPRLNAIFLGDITYEENEISWINQTDVSPLLDAFPNLEHFRVRGGDRLSLGTLHHDRLESLVVETGGLARRVVLEVMGAQLPNLKHLELWLGTAEYGATSTVDDFAPLFAGQLFPKLQYLGLRDSHIADLIAAVVAKAPILTRIDTLDLSLGTLNDPGIQALLDSELVKHLKRLDIHYHYGSDELEAKLVEAMQRAGVTLDASENQRHEKHYDANYHYVAVGE